MYPIPVIFILISTEITSPFQWHSWISKLMPGSIIPFQIMPMHRIPHPTFRISYHVHEWFVYYVVCFFPVLLLRVGSDYVAFVRTHSAMYVCLLHGLVLLPCGISGKMTIPSKSLLSLLARCSLYCYAYAAIPTTCYIMPPILPWQTFNPPCPSKPLFGYVTALLGPSYSIVSCR